jgi:hypothetical protein
MNQYDPLWRVYLYQDDGAILGGKGAARLAGTRAALCRRT